MDYEDYEGYSPHNPRVDLLILVFLVILSGKKLDLLTVYIHQVIVHFHM